MKTIINPSVREAGYEAAVRSASAVLADLSKRSNQSVTEEWDLARDARGLPALVLRLSDPSGQVEQTFRPDELTPGRDVGWKLNLLWGDLLGVRSRWHIGRVEELLRQADADE
jgi:hypothetical protein